MQGYSKAQFKFLFTVDSQRLNDSELSEKFKFTAMVVLKRRLQEKFLLKSVPK